MDKRRFGRTGLDVSLLGFGCGAVGGLMIKGTPADQERAVARALELGINYFDTAQMYGNGESERNLGRVLQKLKPAVYVGTKVRLPPTERGTVQRRPALIPLDRALRRGNAQLAVMLGSVEVELPKLMDLRCGDVLRLPQRLDREITVLCGGKVLARAALGERQGRKCVQLASNP